MSLSSVLFQFLDLHEKSELLERKREASLNLGDLNKDDKLSLEVKFNPEVIGGGGITP